MHGLGNDFVVIDRRSQAFSPSPELLRSYADRRTGIGFDQLLLIDPPTGAADVDWQIFNADGSEAGQCGNGARCVAALVADFRARRVSLAGRAGRLEAEVQADGLVAVAMGVPDFRPAALPFDPAAAGATSADGVYTMQIDGDAVDVGAVSVGNPHVVLEVADVTAAPVHEWGQRLEHHPAFPERTNVGFAQRVDADRIALRVWERGSGETRACGSGALSLIHI